MRRFRFRIGTLLILIVFLGVGFAALRQANDLWDRGLFTLTLGVLLVSVLLAIHRHEGRRAFWIGFALFGWVYLGLTSIPTIESRLLTTQALAYLDSLLPGRPLAITGLDWSSSPTGQGQAIGSLAFSPQGNLVAGGGQSWVGIWDASSGRLLGAVGGTTQDFVRIGHSLLALVLAWLGGRSSRYLWDQGRATVSVPTRPPVPSGTDSGARGDD
jgi:hypothetical protein